MDQKRLLLAFVLSAVILFGWSYLFPPPTNNQQNANTSQPASTESPTPTPTAQSNQAVPQSQSAVPAPLDVTPERTLTVSTSLYEIELDSRGATVKSWIIKQNKEKDGAGKSLRSVSSTRDKPQPLQLISQEGLSHGLAPLKIFTGRQELDAAIASRNFAVSGVEGNAANAQLELKPGEQKSVELTMNEPESGVEVLKKLTFDADNYTVKLETKVLQGGQPVPEAKISIGPSIGDQGVPRYSFYSIAPEAIAAVGEKVEHWTAAQIDQNKESPHIHKFNAPARWAGVGDTYFAMTLVLPNPVNGLEYHTEKYEYQGNGQKEDRFLITGYVPVPADGSPMYLFTGPKDHDQLQETSEFINKNLSGQQIDLGQLINYGWTQRVTKPLATPILASIKYLNRLTGSYGLAIILFTVVIYTLFFPLKWRSSKSMKKAQKLAPRMKELQEKIKGMKQNDPRLKELQMEQLRLMKEGNPLGGCLPLLIQMPFLIALYVAITISIDFRQSSFLWIQDLSAGDPTKLLPILMASSMLVLQLITPAPSADPLQRKMMAVIMPMMMLYILWSAPAGLLVYWLVGNLVGFSQQFLINRMLKSRDDEEQPPEEKDRAGTRPKKKLNDARPTQA
ncbi:MAG: YidC/Oxa1 family rane protein insertase [Acidobacteriota bacterium]|jgi:YidC/Oxa1 family membrane protein insertase|nr:YidC/Oxa1 family rane protein insertase [Acidobacteriota bacterium]